MRRLATRVSLPVVVLCATVALTPASTPAKPGHGPRATVDQRFTSKKPNSPTGVAFRSHYHAKGSRQGRPPPMRRMVVSAPLRYDTSVPGRCTASDLELIFFGPDACPDSSRIGGGTTQGLLLQPGNHSVVVDQFNHPVQVFNNAGEQIVLVQSEGYTVVRGTVRKDNSIVFDPPTCFPDNPGGDCPDDYLIQLGSSTFIPGYTRFVGNRFRSYATTPRRCPRRGFWRTTARFLWADGSRDRVVSRQRCRRPGAGPSRHLGPGRP